MLAVGLTSGLAVAGTACTEEEVQGSIAVDGYEGGSEGSVSGDGYDGSAGCDGCGLVGDSGYDDVLLGPDGFAGVAPGDAAYDASDAGEPTDAGDSG